MKTKLIFAFILILFPGFITSTFGQSSTTATVTATLITPISITNSTDMNFGNVAVSSADGGTVTLQTSGTRKATGGVTLPATTGTVSAATFTVTGETGYNFTITLPSTAITLTSGANSIMVNSFISDPPSNGTLTGGTTTLKVGATLTVPAAQPSGTYTTGSGFTVTVNYN